MANIREAFKKDMAEFNKRASEPSQEDQAFAEWMDKQNAILLETARKRGITLEQLLSFFTDDT